jgi:gliding motility-associated-like protein
LNWKLGNGSFFQDSMSFTYAYEDTGIYNVQLIAINEYNCLDTAIKDISIIPSYTINIPSAFTPNGDNHNEAFHPFGEGFKSYTIRIYNRWGEKIFDGKKNMPWLGEKCSNGEYAYVIDIINLKDIYYQYIGHILLIR